jgi:hypothetical protein
MRSKLFLLFPLVGLAAACGSAPANNGSAKPANTAVVSTTPANVAASTPPTLSTNGAVDPAARKPLPPTYGKNSPAGLSDGDVPPTTPANSKKK